MMRISCGINFVVLLDYENILTTESSPIYHTRSALRSRQWVSVIALRSRQWVSVIAHLHVHVPTGMSRSCITDAIQYPTLAHLD